MSKVLERKKWLNFEEAARLLSAHLKEDTTREDIIHFIIHDRLKCSCILDDVRAHEVTRQTFFPKILNYSDDASDHIKPKDFYAEENSIHQFLPSTSAKDESWIHGVFELPILPRLKLYLQSILDKEPAKNLTLMGFFVIDENATIWKIPSLFCRDYFDEQYLALTFKMTGEEILEDLDQRFWFLVFPYGDTEDFDGDTKKLAQRNEQHKYYNAVLDAILHLRTGRKTPFTELEEMLIERDEGYVLKELPREKNLVVQTEHLMEFASAFDDHSNVIPPSAFELFYGHAEKPAVSHKSYNNSVEQRASGAPLPAQKSINAYLRTLDALCRYIEGVSDEDKVIGEFDNMLKGKQYNVAESIAAKLREKGIELPLSSKALNNYLKEAQQTPLTAAQVWAKDKERDLMLEQFKKNKI